MQANFMAVSLVESGEWLELFGKIMSLRLFIVEFTFRATNPPMLVACISAGRLEA